jgi:hypothetical protein
MMLFCTNIFFNLLRCSDRSMRSQEKEMLRKLNEQHFIILARRQDPGNIKNNI